MTFEFGKWYPIETAPKDGTKIMHCEIQCYPSSIGTCWWVEDPYEGHYWMDDQDSEPQPTHWSPLLPPPPIDGEQT